MGIFGFVFLWILFCVIVRLRNVGDYFCCSICLKLSESYCLKYCKRLKMVSNDGFL